jgi:hypothetical protein
MDPGWHLDILGKQGSLDGPISNEVQMNLFAYLPEDVILIDETSGFSEGKNIIQGIFFCTKRRYVMLIKIKEKNS